MTPRHPDALAVALLVIDLLEELGVDYQVGGSFASSIHGVPRQTNDVDLVADLEARHVPLLVSRLSGPFYLDAERVAQAVAGRTSTNLIHLASGVKVDLFVAERGGFAVRELARSVEIALRGGRLIRVKSPEDTILRKLLWYRMGGETSERQWSDVEGILVAWGGDLDHAYLLSTARELGIGDLLARLLGS